MTGVKLTLVKNNVTAFAAANDNFFKIIAESIFFLEMFDLAEGQMTDSTVYIIICVCVFY